LHGEAWHQDNWQDTFARAYEKAGTFSLPAGVTPEQEQATRLVRGWLGQIANNLLRGLLRNHEYEYSQDEDGWERILNTVGDPSGNAECDPPGAQEERKLIDAALETLSEREQLVLRRTFQYYRIGKEFQRLPNKVVQELADQLATTPENLRSIRKRALAKVKDYVNQRHTEVRSSPNQ
jgi:RNA polymerase sigma factor (sigma-70 family)